MNIAVVPCLKSFSINEDLNEKEVIRFWNVLSVWITKCIIKENFFDVIYIITNIDLTECKKVSEKIKIINNEEAESYIDYLISVSSNKSQDYLCLCNCNFFFNSGFIYNIMNQCNKYNLIYFPRHCIEIGSNVFLGINKDFLVVNLRWLKDNGLRFSKKLITNERKNYYKSLFGLDIIIDHININDKLYFEPLEEMMINLWCQVLRKNIDKTKLLDIYNYPKNSYQYMPNILSKLGRQSALEHFVLQQIVFGYNIQNPLCMGNVKSILDLKQSLLYNEIFDNVQKSKLDKYLINS
jgi:hypothetical protein